MNICAIHPKDMDGIWPRIVGGLENLLWKRDGSHTLDETRDNLDSGEWMLFCAYEDQQIFASFVCRIRRGTYSIFEIGMCWGEKMDEWLIMACAAFEKIARDYDCTKLAINGRPGWVKRGKAFGFTISAVTIIKEVGND